MTKQDLLENSGFNPNEWDILKADQWESLKGAPGFPNNVYRIMSPLGQKEFGKDSRIVKIAWITTNFPDFYNEEKPTAEVVEEKMPEQSEAVQDNSDNEVVESDQPFYCDALEKKQTDHICGEQCKYCEQTEAKMAVSETKEAVPERVPELSGTDEIKKFAKETNSEDRIIIAKVATNVNPEAEEISNEDLEAAAEKLDEISKETSSKKERVTSSPDVESEDVKLVTRIEYLEKMGYRLTQSDEFNFGRNEKVHKDVIMADSEDNFRKLVERLRNDETITKDYSATKPLTPKEVSNKISDAKTVSAEEVKKEFKGTPEEAFDVPEQKKETVSSSVVGFFQEIYKLGYEQVSFTVNKHSADKIHVVVKPMNYSGDAAYDNLAPLSLIGTPEEMDKEFFATIMSPLKTVDNAMAGAKDFIEQLKEAEKKTKAAEAEKKKVKDLLDKAEKIYTDKEFDLDKSGEKALKAYEAVLALDEKNKKANDAVKELKEKLNKLL